jgi:hypothetical protein
VGCSICLVFLNLFERIFTRLKLLGKQLAGAKAFAASPDPPMADRHSARISRGTVKNAG